MLALVSGCTDTGGGSDGSSPGTQAGDDDGGNTAGDDDDDGATMATAGDDGDGDGDGNTDGGSGDDGPVDPTGAFDCPADPYAESATFVGAVLISGDDPNSMSIDVLDGIGVITGDLVIDSTDYSDLDFLTCIVEIHGDVKIFNNEFLLDMSGTDNLTKVGRLPAVNPTPQNPNFVDEGKGSITITGNSMLPDINGFSSLVQIGEQDPEQPPNMQLSPQSLVIRNNGAATTFTGFSSLALIFASLIIQENDSLMDIDGLLGLQGVGKAFSVSRNPQLCISSVNAVGEGLEFLGEPENSTTTLNNDGC